MQLLTRPPRLLSYFHFALVTALCLGCLYLIQIGVFAIAEQQHPWITGDWLINYGSGFVRRGLSGEIVFALARLTGAPPAFVVAYVQLALYIVFFAALLISLFRKTISVPMLLLCVSPATLVFPILDVAALGRKELLVYAALAVFVLHVQRPARDERVRAALWGAIAIVATLMHELFCFYVLYFVLADVLLRDATKPWILPRVSFAIVACSVATFVVLVLFGADIDGDAVCAELIANGLSSDSCNGAMYWQVRPFSAEVANTLQRAATDNYATVYSRGGLLALLPVLAMWLSVELEPQRRELLAGWALCLVWSMPLFLVAVDWGRFLSIHFTLLLVLHAAIAPRATDEKLPTPRQPAARARSIAAYVAVLYVTLLLQSFWGLPHCCQTSLGDGIVGLFLAP